MKKLTRIISLAALTLILQACTANSMYLKATNKAEQQFSSDERSSQIETDIVHKSQGTKFINGEKKAILQAAIVSLVNLGFHINNQNVELGVLSAHASNSVPFLSEEIEASDRLHRERVRSVIKEAYSAPTLHAHMITVAMLSGLSRLDKMSVNILIMDRKDDSQVIMKVTSSYTPPIYSATYTNFRSANHAPKFPLYAVPPAVLESMYKRTWDEISKTLFEHNIILSR